MNKSSNLYSNGNGMDRRQARTRAAIFNAFETLLSNKRYEKITIQELIDEANVGRSTFYTHFETKDDLLKAMCSDLFDHVFSEHPEAERTHDFSAGQEDLPAMQLHILYHLKDDEARLQRIFACESSDLFWRYFREPFFKLVREKTAPPLDACIPQAYLFNHIVTSFIETVRWWFENGLSESPEHIAAYYNAVIQPLLS